MKKEELTTEELMQSVYVYNPLNKEIIGRWDGVNYPLPAKKYSPFARWQAIHFQKHNEDLEIIEIDELQVVPEKHEEPKEDITEEIVEKESKEEVFACEKCGKEYKTEGGLVRHKEKH